MLQVTGKSTGDYFTFKCASCNSWVSVRYLGLDPSVPRVEFSCPKCRESTQLETSSAIAELWPMKPAS